MVGQAEIAESLPCLTQRESKPGAQRLGWLAGELVVVFIGVSAAFVIDNYRDSRGQAAEFHQALSGLIAELNRTETRGHEFADNITSKVDEREKADRNHQRAIPGYYRMPGFDSSASRLRGTQWSHLVWCD